MVPILIGSFYVSFFVWCIYKFEYFNSSNLSKPFITGLFLIKILIAILYGHIHQVYFDGGDTIIFFEESQKIANTFFSYPSYYLQSWLGLAPEIPLTGEVYIYPDRSFIQKDFGTYLLVHLHAFPQMLSWNSYNIHCIFVAMLSLCASLNMYKIASKLVPYSTNLLRLIVFFFPSILFWTSGFHKDLWIYLGLSWLLIGLMNFYEDKKLQYSVFILLLGLLTIGLFRYYLLLLVFPAMVAYLWTIYSSRPLPILRFSGVYLGLVLFAILLTTTLEINFLDILSARQHAFLAEEGGSSITHLVPWEPNIFGFMSFFPDAITNTFFRPFLGNCQDFLQYLAVGEIILFWLFLIYCFRFFSIKRRWHPLNYFILSFTISNLLLIGYLVGNVGTIVRYRSIALGLLAIIGLQLWRRKKPPFKKELTAQKIAKLPVEKL